jgi:hypothetical protein
MTALSHPAPTKARLSASRRRLLESMQVLGFGRIENLVICNHEPVFEPPPKLIRDIKLASEGPCRDEPRGGDFLLKAQAVELFAYLDRLRNGVIDLIEVKHGLPFRLQHTEPVT